MIISRTPFRVSFFGGGTDYVDWYREHGGAVLSTTIDRYCYISVRELPPFFEHRFRLVYSFVENVNEIGEFKHPAVRGVLQWLGVTKGLEIHHDGDLPARSGVGSSSAFTVGLLNALRALEGRYCSKEMLANDAIHVEQCVLREAVGVQDQISAAYGGFNHVTLRQDGMYEVNPMILPRERLQELQRHLMLVFTGVSRTAAEVAKAQIANIRQRTAELRTIRQMVEEAVGILTTPGRDICEFGQLLGESWKIKRQLSERITNATVDDIYETAMRGGAVGGKLLGAGGGGFLLLFVRPQEREAVSTALATLTQVPFRFDMSGSRIVVYQPDGW